MANKGNGGNAPSAWLELMAAEEKRTGLPSGLLHSLVKQETGFQQRFLDDPSAAHYAVGPNGEKPKSSARGFGFLEGTASNPGYGVAPLKDWSVPEQLRFMADYVNARAKQAGSLEGGIAGFGEGPKYAAQVMARLPSARNTQATPMIASKVEQDAPPVQMQAAVVPQVVPPPAELAPLVYTPKNQSTPMEEMAAFLEMTQGAGHNPYMPSNFNFGSAPKFTMPNLSALTQWGKPRAA